MSKAAYTGRKLSLVLCLLVPLGCMKYTMPANAASLCYSFTVGNSGSRPWWNNVQGQLNEETFIYCDSKNNCHAIGLLGNRLMVTKTWESQVDSLKDGVALFKAEVINMKAETNTMREPFTLQATMHCGHDVNGHFHGSWDFGLNGQKMLHFDSSTRKWTEVDSESSQMKSMLKKNGDITDFIYRTSQGDCRSWLEEFKSNEGEKLEPTASPIATPDVDQPSSLAIKPNISVLQMVLTCFLPFLTIFAMTG